ncbi:MAG: hypothetical protein ACTS4V_01025 [Candidatus Hodgkinia cicadicola]
MGAEEAPQYGVRKIPSAAEVVKPHLSGREGNLQRRPIAFRRFLRQRSELKLAGGWRNDD